MAYPLTREELAEALQLKDGALYWRVSRWASRRGARVGHINNHGYRVFTFKGVYMQEHKVIWMLTHGVWPEGLLDHIDGNRANNDPSNIREASSAQNAQNRAAIGSVRFKGVVLHSCGRYQATCGRRYLGLFETAEAAAKAYDAAASKQFGEFARLNFGSAS